MSDKRHVLQWDSEQYVAMVGVNDSLALGVVDTGSCRTLMDESTAQALGLSIIRARGSEFGTYRVPGGDDLHAYVGVIGKPVRFDFGDGVAFHVENMRVLKHPAPLLLIGSDLLRGGRSKGCNFDGLV